MSDSADPVSDIFPGPAARDVEAAGWLAVLAEPTRLALVRTLATGPQPVTRLADRCSVDAMNASYHLRLLKAAGIVSANRSGRFVQYALLDATGRDGAVELAHPSGLKVLVPRD